MTEALRIAPGARVTLHLAISLADGTEALSTFGEQPQQVVIGDGTLDPGIELALYGMRAGESDSLTLRPGQAFGAPDPQLIQEMPLSDFPADAPPREGQIIAFATPGGEELAGRELQLRIAIVDVAYPTGPS